MKLSTKQIIGLIIASVIALTLGYLSGKAVQGTPVTMLPDHTEVSYVIIEIKKTDMQKTFYGGSIYTVKTDTMYIGNEWSQELYKVIHKHDADIEKFREDHWYLFE